MKKKTKIIRFLLVLAIIFAVVLYIPSDKKAVTLEQKNELTAYITNIAELNLIRQQILEAYELHVLGVDKVTDAYRYLEEDIVPPFEAYQTRVMSIKLTDKDVQTVHDHYMKATNKQVEAFHAFVSSYRNQNEVEHTTGNELLKESNKAYRTFNNALHDLAKQYAVKLPSEK